jgi:hypothetical protein
MNVSFTLGSVMPGTTFAYLDAGSGSMILQIMLGGVAAVVVAIKLWWAKLLRLLHIRRHAPASPVGESPRADDGQRHAD